MVGICHEHHLAQIDFPGEFAHQASAKPRALGSIRRMRLESNALLSDPCLACNRRHDNGLGWRVKAEPTGKEQQRIRSLPGEFERMVDAPPH